jgi:hypothetical protein
MTPSLCKFSSQGIGLPSLLPIAVSEETHRKSYVKLHGAMGAKIVTKLGAIESTNKVSEIVEPE